MELLCAEVDMIKRAYDDPTILRDERVLRNLLATEERYLPSPSYFECVQSEIKPYMRKVVADWMLEVCEEQRCEEEVFPLSMNYIDRILSVLPLKKSQIQLLGATCMFIASKLKQTIPIKASKLVLYTDNSITFDDLMEMENLVLHKLKWDLSAVTPHDFLEQILSRLPIMSHHIGTIQRHAHTFMALCATDFKFALYPPSMVAAGAVAASISGLLGADWLNRNLVMQRLQELTSMDIDCLRSCQEQMEEALTTSLPQVSSHKQESVQPTTPTDVMEVHC